VADGEFHGRTITIISFSDDPATTDFGPFTSASVRCLLLRPLESAIDGNTVAVLLELIQVRAG
jgi:ornithine--oxo-acid transaminase